MFVAKHPSRPSSCLLSAALLVPFLLATSQAQPTPPAATTLTLAITSGSPAAPVTSVTTPTAITLTATALSGGKAAAPGQIQFCDVTGGAPCTSLHILGVAQVTPAGTATYKFVPAFGSHTYKAVFIASKLFAASSSATAALTVSGTRPTTSILTVTGSPGSYSAIGSVFASTPTIPVGNVSFLDTNFGNTNLAAGSLGAGTTGFSLASLAPQPVNDTIFEATGDFNGDGIPDLVIPDDGGNMNIYLGNGDGSFRLLSNYAVADSEPGPIVVADFNGDGRADFAVTDIATGFDVFLGNGDGTFTHSASYLASVSDYNLNAIATADFDRNGTADLIMSWSNPDTDTTYDGGVIIYLNNGDGTFTQAPTIIHPSTTPQTLAIADFNGDGIPDFATVNLLDSNVTVYTGNGDGTFNLASTINLPAFGPLDVIADDFDRDGIPDLAIAGNPNQAEVAIYKGAGNGTFTLLSTSVIPDGRYPNYLAVGDFNGDGIQDIVATLSDTRDFTAILLGAGDGTFTFSVSALNPSTGYDFLTNPVVADFNGDGLADIAVIDDIDSTNLVYMSSLSNASTAATSIVPHGTSMPHQVTANYAGQATNASSISIPVALTASPLALTASAPYTHYGQSVTLTATLTEPGTPISGESIVFMNNSNFLASASLTNGIATATTISLPAGYNNITATYLGDSNDSSASASLSYPVLSNVVLTASPASISTTQSTMLQATVQAGTTITGTVTFNDLANGTVLGNCMLASGTCNIQVSAATLPAESQLIQANYSGNLASSTSAPITLDVTNQSPTASAITSPAAGSTLTGSSQTFTWSAGSGVEWQILVGNSLGAENYFHTNSQFTTSALATGLPTNGTRVYVRLNYFVNNAWKSLDYTYTASTPAPVASTLTSPTPSTTLAGSSVIFTWNAQTASTQNQLYVGTRLGASNFYTSGQLYNKTSTTVTGLPLDSQTIYVRLWSYLHNGWVYQDYTYTAAK